MKNNYFRMSKSIILRVFESIILIVFNIVWKYESRKNFLVDREREREVWPYEAGQARQVKVEGMEREGGDPRPAKKGPCKANTTCQILYDKPCDDEIPQLSPWSTRFITIIPLPSFPPLQIQREKHPQWIPNFQRHALKNHTLFFSLAFVWYSRELIMRRILFHDLLSVQVTTLIHNGYQSDPQLED